MTISELDDLAREERREYYRKWRAEHKDNVKKHNQNYWRKKAAQKLKKEEEKNG